MDHSRKCMSIDAIVSNDTFPLSPPESYSSLSPTLSPKLTSMVPPLHEHSHTVQNKQKESHHMSIEERRHRNKLASAKYRAKKQANMKTISTKVSELMESNSELSDELKRVKQENAVLRAMCEKMMAQNPSLANQDAFSHVIL